MTTEVKEKAKKTKKVKKEIKNEAVKRDWYLLNAESKNLGRLSTRIADILTGKNKPTFSRDVDKGGFVVVVNAEKIKVTGRKLDEKKYYTHSGYPGGLKIAAYKDLLKNNPSKVLEKAVNGMLPKNKLRKDRIKRLKIYKGENHPHKAQNPVSVE